MPTFLNFNTRLPQTVNSTFLEFQTTIQRFLKTIKMVSLTAVLIATVILVICYYLFKEEKYPGKLPPGKRNGVILGDGIMSVFFQFL